MRLVVVSSLAGEFAEVSRGVHVETAKSMDGPGVDGSLSRPWAYAVSYGAPPHRQRLGAEAAGHPHFTRWSNSHLGIGGCSSPPVHV